MGRHPCSHILAKPWLSKLESGQHNLCFQVGVRFSRNDAMPSGKSLVHIMVMKVTSIHLLPILLSVRQTCICLYTGVSYREPLSERQFMDKNQLTEAG